MSKVIYDDRGLVMVDADDLTAAEYMELQDRAYKKTRGSKMDIFVNVKRSDFMKDIVPTKKGLKITTAYDDIYLQFDDEETADKFKYMIGLVVPKKIKGAK